jgi:hypothetical protein
MIAQSETETWVVAEEYGTAAFKRLGLALESLGYAYEKGLSGVGGSQELRLGVPTLRTVHCPSRRKRMWASASMGHRS